MEFTTVCLLSTICHRFMSARISYSAQKLDTGKIRMTFNKVKIR